MSTSCEIALRWMPQNADHLLQANSGSCDGLVQAITWANVDPHLWRRVVPFGQVLTDSKPFLGQCWLRSLTSYGVIRPLWVKSKHGQLLRLLSWYLVISSPCISFKTGVRSLNDLQWLEFKIRYQDSNPSNGYQMICPLFLWFILHQTGTL